jgi:2-oxoglutarate dehydrogenase E2 component (dihydrolipoamide succinyltransferase)
MQFEVKLPSLGEDANDEAEVALWSVKEGDAVKEGDDLVEVTTDKAAFTLPSPKTGTVVEQRCAEGAKLRVGDVLCVLELKV